MPRKTIDAEDEIFGQLEKHQPAGGLKFYSLKLPSGQTLYGYVIRFLSDMQIIPNTRYPNADGTPKPEKVVNVEFTQVYHDDEVKVGDKARINFSRHASGNSYWDEHGLGKKDEAYAVMIKPKVKASKGGMSYYPYSIMKMDGAMSTAQLEAIFSKE